MRSKKLTASQPDAHGARYDGFVTNPLTNASTPNDRYLRGARLAGENWSGRDLRGANLVMANLEAMVLNDALLGDAHMHGCRLRNASLSGGLLQGVQARDADFEGANLSQANLAGANLRCAILLEANLTGADLSGADLRGADLRSADLSGAQLEGALLDGADLAGAILDGATFLSVSASGARVQWTQGDLVEALLAAGAHSRPPLAIGRVAAVLGAAARTLGIAFGWLLGAVTTRLGPVGQILRKAGTPVVRVGSLLGSKSASALRRTKSIPATLGRGARTGLESGARQSQQLAARVRTEVQDRLQASAQQRQERRIQEAERATQARVEAAAKVQSRLPGGPGADLSGRDFSGARLNFAVWTGAKLTNAVLDGAALDKADLRAVDLADASLVGARLRDADLSESQLCRANFEGGRLRAALFGNANAAQAIFVDADLRHVDLEGTDLSGANLSGADLRGAKMRGAILRNADLSGARMPDVDLIDAVLDGAILNQADVAGVRWSGASVTGANLTGVLGLGAKERDGLRQLGASVDELHLERLLGRLGARPVQLGMGILALGMVSYLAARFAGEEAVNPAQLEVAAQDLRDSKPGEASKRYVELAAVARRVEDKVGYLVEAALMAEASSDTEEAEALFIQALDSAEGLPLVANETRLRLAVFLNDHQRWADSLEAVEPLVSEVDQPTEQRARAMVLYDQNRMALGVTDGSARDTVFSSMGDLSETQADLHLALAELYTNSGDTTAAMLELDTAAGLDVPDDLRIRLMETRARTQDRAGDYEGAIVTWMTVIEAAEEGSIAAQAAPLAIADLHLRQGRTKDAIRHLSTALSIATDDRVRGRALLVQARVAEKQGRAEEAIEAYRTVIGIEELDSETLDEARISLAAVVLADGSAPEATAMLADLAPNALIEVMAHAKLGEARQLLDEGDAALAHPIYEALANDSATPTMIRRAARAGLGEALAQMGELRDALDLWRELLAQPATTHDRLQLELLVANGLLQGGKRKEAATAFRSLADAENKETSVQGLLGLAEVARSASERARAKSLYRQVADQQVDSVWKVRALQELADMAAEDGDPETVVALSRELVGALPPGHISAPEARLSLIGALSQTDALEEANQLCRVAISAAPNPRAAASARVLCAEVRERSGDWEGALSTYTDVLNSDSLDDVLTDAALGVARCGFALRKPAGVLAPIEQTLASVKAPALRLPLLTMHIRALESLNRSVELSAAKAERDALAEQVPEIAWMAFVEDAGQARSSGQSEAAAATLQQALNLPITNRQRATVLVELGSAMVDLARLEEGRSRFETALEVVDEDSPEAFYAGMGLAEIERRNGRPRLALERLSALTPPDASERRSLLTARATALTEAQDDGAEAAWKALADLSETDPGARYAALKGQADSLVAADAPSEAMVLYAQARKIAMEDWQEGWAGIGLATAMANTEDFEGAAILLDELLLHSDPEVRLEASLRRSQLAADQGDWPAAVKSLNPEHAIALGPAWDASATGARARALVGAGDSNGAEAAWRALARRWPDQEEAVLPAWLGLAQLSMDTGATKDAHHWARKAFKEARDPGYKAQAEAIVSALKE